MQLVAIDRKGVDTCFQSGVVKPNEYRQIYSDLVQKELQLRQESVTLLATVKAILLGKNIFEMIYQELSHCQEDMLQCIINLASSDSNKLLLTPEESKKLFLSYIFYKKSVVVRDCSDIFKHPLVKQDSILVDKETLRSIEYLISYTAGAKALLTELQN